MKELFPVENPTIVVFLLLGVKHFEVKGYLVGHKDFWLVMFFFFCLRVIGKILVLIGHLLLLCLE